VISATYPLMEKASEWMDAEFQENTILQILENGNISSWILKQA